MNGEDIIREKLLNNIDPITKRLKVIFWIGAGIDMDLPTGLPSGRDLTDFLLKNACPNSVTQKLQNIGAEKQHDYLRKLYGEPRLESIIECYHTLETALKPEIGQSFLQGFSSFMNCEPNDIHYALAYMMQRGAELVTTNYDNCIAKAYERKFDKKCYLKQLNPYGYYCYQTDDDFAGKIYHIHGVASDVGTLGASLSKLKDGLAREFEEKVIKWLRDGYTFVFMGYGAGDSLDVNPFFEALPIFSESCGIFISHKNTSKSKVTRMGNPDRSRAILSCFGTAYNYEGITRDFITSISHVPKMGEMVRSEKAWQDKFMQNCTELNEELRLGLSLQICSSLGINPRRILPHRWWMQLSYMEKYIEPWYIKYYGFAIGKQLRSERILKCFKPEQTDTDLYISDYYAAFHQYYYAAKQMGTPRTLLYFLCSRLENNESIGWDISTGLNRWATYMEWEVLRRVDNLDWVLKKHSTDFWYLSMAFKIILENSMQMEQISQCYTAERFYIVMQVFMNKEIDVENEIEKTISQYEDISYWGGVIGTKMIYLLCHSVEIYRGHDRKHHLFSGATLIMNLVKEIVKYRQLYYVDTFGRIMIFFLKCIAK